MNVHTAKAHRCNDHDRPRVFTAMMSNSDTRISLGGGGPFLNKIQDSFVSYSYITDKLILNSLYTNTMI